MADATGRHPFFMRARTRSLTRWGGVSILAALCVLGIAVTDDPVEATPMVAEAVFRADDIATLEGYPEFAHFRGEGRNIFRFAEPPAPETPAPEPIAVAPTPEPVEPPPPQPEPPSLNTAGLQVQGIVAAPGGTGWAIVSGAGQYDQVVKIGDTVRGATVKRIEHDRVTLELDGVLGTLKLRESYTPFEQAPDAGSAESGRPFSPAPAGGEAPPRRRSLGLSVRLDPGGRGLQVTRVNRIDVNVQVGDVITSIEGQAVTDLAVARQLLAGAKEKDAIQLAILRAGLPTAVTIPMVE